MAKKDMNEEKNQGTSLAVQWLRFHTSTVGGVGSITGQELKILHAARCHQKENKRKKN